jgi:anaerobic ribonucleoside-triphosphate reductase activating protein
LKVAINRLHYPVTALGPGRRLGVWFQGCSLACHGCLSRDTWDPAGGTVTTVATLLEAAEDLCPEGPDGVTITGGEPFEQAEALDALVTGVRRWSSRHGREIDILAYSGVPLATLLQEHEPLVSRLDALIPEPFVVTNPPDGPWRGSGNQPLVILSELGEQRFAQGADERPTLQVSVDDGVLWLIGVPRPGDLSRLGDELRTRGVVLEDVSWRP